jgi:hypothetical protein
MRRVALLAVTATITTTALAPSAVGAGSANVYFKPPWSKVYCVYLVGVPKIRCDLQFKNDTAIALTKKGAAKKVKVTDSIARKSATKLVVGDAVNYGPFTCSAGKDDLNCHNRANAHGFTITRDYQKLF